MPSGNPSALVLKWHRKRFPADHCGACGEWCSGLASGWQVGTEGDPRPVCEGCIEYHAPELIAARAAANALFDVLDAKRREREVRQQPPGQSIPF